MEPIRKFAQWLSEASRHPAITEPTAMCLATADAKGHPSARMVLLKEADGRGFVFYTNMESRKGEELKANPYASLCFYWMPLGRQVRIDGKVEQVTDQEADAYFASRPRESCLGAWASAQSRPCESREELEKALARETARFEGKDVARPPYWSGWRVVPERIEFWQQGEHRLHDRELFTRDGNGWKITRLYP